MLEPGWKKRKWKLKNTGETKDGSSDTQRSAGGDTPTGGNHAGPSEVGPIRPEFCGRHEPQTEQAGSKLHGDGETTDTAAYAARESISSSQFEAIYYPIGPAIGSKESDKFRASLNLVMYEMHHSIRKHGSISSDPVRRASILGAEVGEVLEAANHYTSPKARTYGSPEELRANLRMEIAQVAATAIITLMEMEREDQCRLR